MPSTGTLAVKIAGSADGASPSMTDAGPPDRMMPRGSNISRVALSTDWKGWISQYTPASRTRRAINWVTWEPKSTIKRRSDFWAAMGGYKRHAPALQCGLPQDPPPHSNGEEFLLDSDERLAYITRLYTYVRWRRPPIIFPLFYSARRRSWREGPPVFFIILSVTAG